MSEIYRNVKKTILLIFLLLPCFVYSVGLESEINCVKFVVENENYKSAHKNNDCIEAAEIGSSSAQYSVGLAYGVVGRSELEEKYYRLSANQGNIAAYLGLGHFMKLKGEYWEAIYWYQKYVNNESEGYGYAAILISDIFLKLGNLQEAMYWQRVCEESGYQGCFNAKI